MALEGMAAIVLKWYIITIYNVVLSSYITMVMFSLRFSHFSIKNRTQPSHPPWSVYHGVCVLTVHLVRVSLHKVYGVHIIYMPNLKEFSSPYRATQCFLFIQENDPGIGTVHLVSWFCLEHSLHGIDCYKAYHNTVERIGFLMCLLTHLRTVNKK